MGIQKVGDFHSKSKFFDSSKFVVGSTSYHRGFSSNGDPYTLFVGNLPNKAEVPWFRKFFSNFGKVIEAFIPNKRSMKTGNKFGFIRYTNSRSAINAIAQASGLWIGRRNLIVKQASYGRRNHRQDLGNPTSTFNRSTPFQYSQTRTDGGRDYHYNNRSFTQLKELEKRVTINLQPTASEWLWRSAIADLNEVSTPEIIQKAFSDLEFKDVQVRSMGGKFMLITFQNVVDRNNALVNHVIKGWFHSLKLWKGDAASLSRLIWLNIRGMPLNAWELKSFKKIAESWGEFLVLDQETLSMDSFDVGRLLMVTNCKYKIDEWINVIVKGRNYQVQVWEEVCNDPFDVKGANHDHQFCIINRPSHNPAKDCASHVDIQSKDKDVEKANSVHKEGEEAVYQKDNFDNLETLAHDVPGGEDLLLDSCDRHAMPDERDANEVLFFEVVGSQNPLSANSVLGNQESHSAEVVHETPSQSLKEIEANKQAFIEDGTLKNVLAAHVEPANKEQETQGQSGNAAFSGEHALMDSGHNKSNNDVDKQVVISTNEPLNEECEPSKNEIPVMCPHADFFENNNTSIQAAVKGVQGKRRRKKIEEILGNSKVNKWNHKDGKGKKKCVVLRSAIASAALTASVSSGGISNRNKIILSEAQAVRQMEKLIGYKYDGGDEEVISKIRELEALEKVGVEGQLGPSSLVHLETKV